MVQPFRRYPLSSIFTSSFNPTHISLKTRPPPALFRLYHRSWDLYRPNFQEFSSTPWGSTQLVLNLPSCALQFFTPSYLNNHTSVSSETSHPSACRHYDQTFQFAGESVEPLYRYNTSSQLTELSTLSSLRSYLANRFTASPHSYTTSARHYQLPVRQVSAKFVDPFLPSLNSLS